MKLPASIGLGIACFGLGFLANHLIGQQDRDSGTEGGANRGEREALSALSRPGGGSDFSGGSDGAGGPKLGGGKAPSVAPVLEKIRIF